MALLDLSRHPVCWMVTTRKMTISSGLRSRFRRATFGVGFHSIAKTISHNQPSPRPRRLTASVRSANLPPISHRIGQKPEVFAKDLASRVSYWNSRALWKRAGINTLRCLVSCTLGDFSTMWFLQSQYPSLGIYLIMGISSKAT